MATAYVVISTGVRKEPGTDIKPQLFLIGGGGGVAAASSNKSAEEEMTWRRPCRGSRS